MIADRVRENTSDSVNRRLDEDAADRIAWYARQPEHVVARRMRELDEEWDMERWLEANASSLAFAGLVLGVTADRRWLFVPGIVLPFLFLHAVQGWCPPVPVLRRLGVRTRKEIDHEKFALLDALRGGSAGTMPTENAAVFI